MTNWTAPSKDDLQTLAALLFPDDKAKKIRKLCLSLESLALKKNIVSSAYDLHDEIQFGKDTPFHQTIYGHLAHLIFFEKSLNKSKLNILDLCGGNGEFTYLARNRGHNCVLTECTHEAFNSSELNTEDDLYKMRQSSTRDILGLEYEDLVVKWNSSFSFNQRTFDIIYANHCTFYYPGSGFHDYWQNHHWHIFLGRVLKLLNPNGMIFITLADPTYMYLSNFLLNFYVEYSHLFHTTPTDLWWSLLVVKNERRYIELLDGLNYQEEKSYFENYGKTNRDLIKKRLPDV